MPFYVVTEGADWYEPRSVVFVSTDLSKAQDEVKRLATDKVHTNKTLDQIGRDEYSISMFSDDGHYQKEESPCPVIPA